MKSEKFSHYQLKTNEFVGIFFFDLPTAVKLKKPCSHSPIYAARSLMQNKPGTNFATLGLTESNSP
jgi:hypothetical protein